MYNTYNKIKGGKSKYKNQFGEIETSFDEVEVKQKKK